MGDWPIARPQQTQENKNTYIHESNQHPSLKYKIISLADAWSGSKIKRLSGFRIPAGARVFFFSFSPKVPTGTGTHPKPPINGYRGSSPGGKAPGLEFTSHFHLASFCNPHMPSWRGDTFFFSFPPWK